jgi:arylformamidase
MFDISLPIDAHMPVWPGDPRPRQHWLQRLDRGDPVDLSQWSLGAHTGTHLDAPSHFVGGAADIDALDPRLFVGPCQVLDCTSVSGEIGRTQLRQQQPGSPRVLLKTRPSASVEQLGGLAPDAADLLIEAGTRLVGIDALSIESYAAVQRGAPVHQRLLGAGVVILEGLDLRAIGPGRYILVVLPLRLRHSEASPARALLFDEPAAFRQCSGQDG